MKMMCIIRKFAFTAALFIVSLVPGKAQLITVEPDNYADGTILNTVVPGVRLITTERDNVPIPLFSVTANIETLPFHPPTGDKVFGHVNIPFWNDVRRLRMDFDGVVSAINIDFMGSTPLATEQGRLEVYGTQGQLLTSYTTQPLLGGQVETMGIQRDEPDVAWAVAYTLPGQSVFGRLDHLVFSQPVLVPEPGTNVILILTSVGAVLWTVQRRRQH